MTVAEMRSLLGLGSGVSDAAVVDAYVIYLEGAPAAPEPVSLIEMRSQLRMTESDPTDQDPLIERLIRSARGMVEKLSGLTLTRRQVVQNAHSFTNLDLYAWPIISIDAVSYFDRSGVEQVLDPSSYRIIPSARPARLQTGFGAIWPSISAVSNGVTVVATAGFATPDIGVPDEDFQIAKQAIILAADYWFRNGVTDETPPGVWGLCRLLKRFVV